MAKLNLNGDGNEENHSAANLQPSGGGKKGKTNQKTHSLKARQARIDGKTVAIGAGKI